MKSKGLTYGLLVVVGIIWYQVFVRVKSNFEGDESQIPPARAINLTKSIRKPNDFELQANFNDPFHTGVRVKKSIKKQEGNSTAFSPLKPKKQVPQAVYWPEIKYYGYVRNTNSKKPRAIVSIDGHLFKLQTGDEVFDNIRIVKAAKNELKVKYKGETKTFFKK